MTKGLFSCGPHYLAARERESDPSLISLTSLISLIRSPLKRDEGRAGKGLRRREGWLDLEEPLAVGLAVAVARLLDFGERRRHLDDLLDERGAVIAPRSALLYILDSRE